MADFGAGINGGKWHFDFEQAAYQAFQGIFPEAEVFGCVFHYAKSLNSKKDEVGLSVQYRQVPAIKTWFRRLVALCMVPPWLVPYVSQDLLNNVPWTGVQLTDNGLQAFKDYFQAFWMAQNMVPIWNCWANMGPRMTNHTEGWHSALRFKFRNRHPVLGEFLVEIQKWHHGYSLSGRNLLAGVQQPAPRRPQDVQNDQRILQAKNNLQVHINTQHLVGQGPDQATVFRFLDHIQHMIGQQ